jgi:hypothetical protein
VVEELNAGEIDVHDPDFLKGLADHVSRLALADPARGRSMLGKIIRLKKQLTRSLAESAPGAVRSATIVRSKPNVGRNQACPCGSGRKYKQCCLHPR